MSEYDPQPERPEAPEQAHTSAQPGALPQPEEGGTVTVDSVRVHRSPRYFRFMLTGAVVFAVIAFVLTVSFPENSTYDRGSVFGFLLAICATVGAALGALLALLIDRSVTRQARTVQADKIDVRLHDSGPGDVRPSGSRPSVDR